MEAVVVVGYGTQKKGQPAGRGIAGNLRRAQGPAGIVAGQGPARRDPQPQHHLRLRSSGRRDQSQHPRRGVDQRQRGPARAHRRHRGQHRPGEPQRRGIGVGAQGRRLCGDLRSPRRLRRDPDHHEEQRGRQNADQLQRPFQRLGPDGLHGFHHDRIRCGRPCRRIQQILQRQSLHAL